MKYTQSLYIILLFFILCSFGSKAQNVLSEEDKMQIQERSKSVVEDFQQYLSDIVNTKLSDLQRKESMTAALKLFIGKGDEYYVINEYNEKEKRNPVKMQISSVNRSSMNWRKMKDYLDTQFRLSERSTVKIDAADVVRVDNVYQVGEGRYQAVAYFCQKYLRYTDRGLIYGDITGKKVILHITAIPTDGKITWNIEMGDMYVTETKRI